MNSKTDVGNSLGWVQSMTELIKQLLVIHPQKMQMCRVLSPLFGPMEPIKWINPTPQIWRKNAKQDKRYKTLWFPFEFFVWFVFIFHMSSIHFSRIFHPFVRVFWCFSLFIFYSTVALSNHFHLFSIIWVILFLSIFPRVLSFQFLKAPCEPKSYAFCAKLLSWLTSFLCGTVSDSFSCYNISIFSLALNGLCVCKHFSYQFH